MVAAVVVSAVVTVDVREIMIMIMIMIAVRKKTNVDAKSVAAFVLKLNVTTNL
ncbi:hypothetical protein [Geomicrobium sp. JCM 19038]|uniref:hypothetical protein n=1 Tax=Geomicrobium sp. JCM 19038 TaxID=1460635 RepID=UPI00045F169A|nr:hypothetical protein [Geomicrobium sp. JCM 19038]GAK07344.1 hypothetical protein JCM19038_1077 [Geomicrobium sp. JCM 19038]